MAKLTLTDLANLQNENTAVSAINANNALIETALENTYSRDGTSPNTMNANLDMNSFHILNLPNPSTANEPLRYQDLSDFVGGGTVTNLPAGGSTRAVLAKTSATDYAVGWSTTTGTGSVVYSTTPTLVTPVLGVATATSINKLTITAPATSAVLTIIDGKTLTANNSITLAGTDTTTITFQGTDTYVGRNTTDTLTNKTITAGVITATTLTPVSNDGTALGTTALQWSDLFLATGGVINWANGDITITGGGDTLSFAGASTNGYIFDNLIRPVTNDGAALGAPTLSWSDLFLASGSVINFANGDATITHSSDTLQFGGATAGGYIFDSTVRSGVNDGAALGAGGLAWSDLFLASGGVINFANGDVSIIHSGDALSFSGGANGYFFSNTIFPTSNDVAALGVGTNAWSDLFLASGGVINWNNGAYTLTQATTNLAHSGSISVGANSGTNGSVKFFGSTSGDVTIKAAAAAGTATNFQLPASNGSSGQFLQTDGSGNASWQTGSGAVTTGNRVLLSTLTASASASLVDTTNLTSTYDYYELVFEGILPATNAVTPRLRVNSGGIQTTTYLSNIAGSTGNENPTTYIPIGSAVAGLPQSNTGPGLYGRFTIYQPSGTSAPKMVLGQSSYLNSSGLVTYQGGGGYWNGGNGAVTGFEFTMSSGNITSGTIKLYGIVN